MSNEKQLEKPYNHDAENMNEAFGLDVEAVFVKVNKVLAKLREEGLPTRQSRLLEALEKGMTKRELAVLALNSY